jgi:regulator of protease activity HflC (stomatin/prohibitin superfamily)
LFDKLIELAVQFMGLFKFWFILNPSMQGIVLTWGKLTRRIGSSDGLFGTGLHLKAPFDIEEVFTLSTAARVDEFAAQTLVTKDGRNVIVGVVVTYRVHDVDKALNSVYQGFDAIQDAVQANVATAVITTNFADIPTMAFADEVTAISRKKGFVYGFEIETVRLAEFAPTRTYRLMGDGHL